MFESGPRSLVIRKLADKQPGEERIPHWDSRTGDKTLINPKTGAAEPWPLLGVMIMGDPPQTCTVSTSWVTTGISEGWLESDGATPIVRPSGVTQDQWSGQQQPHLFLHIETLVIKTVDGDVRYRVVHQPDKYAEDGDDEMLVTPDMYEAGATRVDHFYGLVLED